MKQWGKTYGGRVKLSATLFAETDLPYKSKWTKVFWTALLVPLWMVFRSYQGF
ncbi:MAG TPA: hypothetical protein VFV50_01170 [Bdellovibrionales bacterium]|nr:hypothetical protein [Bdellovibrionales bacterium]